MSAVSRALSGGERKLYLMGWIAAVDYPSPDGEWGLNCDGKMESRWGSAIQRTKVHRTLESALSMARMRKSDCPNERVYVRSYAYETPNVETAKKFCVQPLQDFVPMKEFV